MNKQALAFFSMFTLVLMLSIYYVSLEPTPVNTDETDQIKTVMMLMQEQNDEQKELLLLDLKEQLASTTITESKKIEVLSKIDQIESNKKIEENVVELLLEKGIKSVVCIENKVASINIFEVEESSKKAEEIMTLVYKLVGSNLSIELIFSWKVLLFQV